MRFTICLILLSVFVSCSTGDDGIENTPATIEILFPEPGATYYHGKFPDYMVLKISDEERNIQSIRIFGGTSGSLDFGDYLIHDDGKLYDNVPDTITLGVQSVMNPYIDGETFLTVEVTETDEAGLFSNSAKTTFNLIADSVIISNPLISDVEVVYQDLVNANVSFDIHTESGDLSTIMAIRFTRFPNLEAYEPGHYFSTYYNNGENSGDPNNLVSNSYSAPIHLHKTDSELYALIYVKHIHQGLEYKFYVVPVGTL